MKKILVLLFVGISAVSSGPAIYAQIKTSASVPVKKAVSLKLSGEVVSVDAANMQIVIKDKKGTEQTFSADAGAKFTKRGKVIQLSEITTGDKVNVVYKAGGEKKVIVSAKILLPIVKKISIPAGK
jgi:hypothetical protein